MVERLAGQLNGSGRLSGTLLAPQVNGNLMLSGGEVSGAELPASLQTCHAGADCRRAGAAQRQLAQWRGWRAS
jgi:autotransporter translocation and assembly factor TamB